MNHKHKLSVVIIACIALLMIAQLSCFATTYYVAASGGSNTNAGTSTSAPWSSINEGDSKSTVAGDVVYVKGGTTYTASSTLAWSSRAGAVGNPITYVACNSSWVPTQGGVTISGSMTGST